LKRKIYNAIIDGNVEQLNSLIKKEKVDVNALSTKKITILNFAIKQKKLEIIKFLVKARAKVDQIENQKISPLHQAVKQEDFAIVKYLIKKGANVNQENNQGNTALHEATINDNQQIAELLVKKYADTDVQNNQGNTALHEAIINGNQQIAELLIEECADTDTQNNQGNTALHEAIINDNQQIAELLIEECADTDTQNNQGNTELHEAIINGNQQVAKLLIKKYAATDTQNNQGNTALHEAIVNGNQQVAKLLIKKYAVKDTQNNQGNTALHEAIINGNQQVAKLLIKKYAAKDTQNNQGNTALHEAIINDNQQIAKLLIKNYAAKDTQNNQGNTALHEAIINGNQQIAELLIKKYATTDTQNNQGNTALHEAAGAGYTKVVEQILCKENVVVDVMNHQKQTPIEIAFKNKHLLVVHLLHLHGSNIQKNLDSISDSQKKAVLMNDKGKIDDAVKSLLIDLDSRPLVRSWAEIFKNTDTKKYFKQQIKKIQKDVNLRKLPTHFLGLDDKNNTDFSQKGEGLDELFAARQFNKVLNKINPIELNGYTDEFEKIFKAFNSSTIIDRNFINNKNFYDTNKLIIINSGWPGHSVTIAATRKFLLVANRGEGIHERGGCIIYFLEKMLNARQINDLSARRSKLEIEAQILKVVKKQDGEPKILHAFELSEQKYGTCSIANKKAAVAGLLPLVNSLTYNSKGKEYFNQTLFTSQLDAARISYKQFTYYTRLVILKDNLVKLNKSKLASPKHNEIMDLIASFVKQHLDLNKQSETQLLRQVFDLLSEDNYQNLVKNIPDEIMLTLASINLNQIKDQEIFFDAVEDILEEEQFFDAFEDIPEEEQFFDAFENIPDKDALKDINKLPLFSRNELNAKFASNKSVNRLEATQSNKPFLLFSQRDKLDKIKNSQIMQVNQKLDLAQVQQGFNLKQLAVNIQQVKNNSLTMDLLIKPSVPLTITNHINYATFHLPITELSNLTLILPMIEQACKVAVEVVAPQTVFNLNQALSCIHAPLITALNTAIETVPDKKLSLELYQRPTNAP